MTSIIGRFRNEAHALEFAFALRYPGAYLCVGEDAYGYWVVTVTRESAQ